MKSLDALRSQPRSDSSGPSKLGRGLGWFSVALGLTEIATPKLLAKLVGAHPTRGAALALRVAGVRELGTGIAILMMPNRPLPLWLRVAGDALDLAMIGVAATHRKANGLRLAGAAAAIAGVAALDMIASVRAARAFEAANHPVVFSVTIAKSPREVYDFFRKLERLPEFMDYLDSVKQTDTTHSTWTAKLPAGGTVSWNAEIVDDRPGESIAWKTVADAPFELDGRVTFAQAPARDMTEVRVEMKLGVLGRAPSSLLAKLFAKPQVKGDLRRLKQVLETGEVLYSDASQHVLPHAAQPAKPADHVKTTQLPFIPTPPTADKGAHQ
ncbi:MAG TPA: SRPBCC family protein [Kofleriaceae bacterium]|jgi:uncharacterized membrane protein|nr:SRPBCC family protein [Kofleriaceae bacterium]